MKNTTVEILLVVLLSTPASLPGQLAQKPNPELQASFSQISQGGVPQDSALTNADITNMVQAKLGDELMIAKIKSSPSNFDTGIDAILKLKAAASAKPSSER